MNLRDILSLIAFAVFCGAFCWVLMWPVMRFAPRLRFKPAFADWVLNGSAEQARMQLRRCESQLSLLAYAATTTVVAFLVLLFARPVVPGWIAYLSFILACLLALTWGIFVFLRLRNWRELRFAARANAAIGAALARLALQGHRVFHGISVGESHMDHVVAGPRGVFVIKVVPHRPLKDSKTVRLSERSLAFDDGTRLSDPLVEVERSARLLSKIVSRVSNHRMTVRPVLAVPGWDTAPVNGGDLLLMNEKNAVMLPGWSRPADHLMEQDVPELHERLVRLCFNRRL